MFTEKEWGIVIGDDFPISKLLNWYDQYNMDRYNKTMKRGMSKGGTPQTFR
jgi:hypothetical protein